MCLVLECCTKVPLRFSDNVKGIGIGNVISGDHPWPYRPKPGKRLAQEPLAGAKLQIPGRNVVPVAIAKNIVERVAFVYLDAALSDNHDQFRLIIQLAMRRSANDSMVPHYRIGKFIRCAVKLRRSGRRYPLLWANLYPRWYNMPHYAKHGRHTLVLRGSSQFRSARIARTVRGMSACQ